MNERIRALCTVDLPYPSAQASYPSGADAAWLFCAYAGSGGALAAYLQYLYAAEVLRGVRPSTLFSVFSVIAETKRRHLMLLAEMLTSLGEKPVFRTPGGRAGALSALDERKDAACLLSTAYARETRSAALYRQSLFFLREPNARALVRRLLSDEERHAEIFERLLSEIS